MDSSVLERSSSEREVGRSNALQTAKGSTGIFPERASRGKDQDCKSEVASYSCLKEIRGKVHLGFKSQNVLEKVNVVPVGPRNSRGFLLGGREISVMDNPWTA